MQNKYYLNLLPWFGFFILILATGARSGSIELGMSTSLSGPNQFIGQAMFQGMNAYFNEINQQGGIRGQIINLTVLDDGYEPDGVLSNTRQLIDQYNVIAIVGNAGTPTSAIAAPIANQRGVVFYGAFTGADILRKVPPDSYVFNFRASYRQEMDVIIRDIIERGIAPHRIAFFVQDDSLGQTGLDNAKAALEHFGFKQGDQLLVTRYQRNSLSIQNAVSALIKAKPEPEAIIMVGAYKPIAQFIQFSHRTFPKTKFYSLSFSGASLLTQALAGIHGRIYMTQVVPPVTPNTDDPSEHNFIWHEGYFAAKILVKALNRIQGEITSSRLKEALEDLGSFYIEDFGVLSFSADNHQASQMIWLTYLDKSFRWLEVKDHGEDH